MEEKDKLDYQDFTNSVSYHYYKGKILYLHAQNWWLDQNKWFECQWIVEYVIVPSPQVHVICPTKLPSKQESWKSIKSLIFILSLNTNLIEVLLESNNCVGNWPSDDEWRWAVESDFGDVWNACREPDIGQRDLDMEIKWDYKMFKTK